MLGPLVGGRWPDRNNLSLPVFYIYFLSGRPGRWRAAVWERINTRLLGNWELISGAVLTEYYRSSHSRVAAMLLIITNANIFIPTGDTRQARTPGLAWSHWTPGDCYSSARDQNVQLKYKKSAPSHIIYKKDYYIAVILKSYFVAVGSWLVTAQTFPACQTQSVSSGIAPSFLPS